MCCVIVLVTIEYIVHSPLKLHFSICTCYILKFCSFLKNVEQLHKEQTCWLFFEDIVNLKYFNGTEPRYVPLPKVVKSGFILVQTNADTERSLSVYALAWFSDIQGCSRSLSLPAKGTANDLGRLRIRLCMPTLWHRKGHFLERGLLLAQDLWKMLWSFMTLKTLACAQTKLNSGTNQSLVIVCTQAMKTWDWKKLPWQMVL